MYAPRTVATARRARRTATRRRALVAGLGGLTAVALLAPAHTSAAATTTTTTTTAAAAERTLTARAIVGELAERGLDVRNPRGEGPRTVVRGGVCVRLADLGCEQMVSTKDASVMVFRTATLAAAYVGGADDEATRVGRVVLSWGSPARVVPSRRPAYIKALRQLLDERPTANDAVRLAVALAGKGLLMRDAHDEGPSGIRLGLASEIPGAVQMVATDGPSVIRFGTAKQAQEYVGGADDDADRVGRVVVSFGSPARVAPARQAAYTAALKEILTP